MKNHSLIALTVLLLTLGLLLGAASLYPEYRQWQDGYETSVYVNGEEVNMGLKFASPEQLFTFLKPANQKKAAKRLKSLLAKEKRLRPGASPDDVDNGDSAKIVNPIDNGQHALDNFFLALTHLAKEPQPLRVAHYGDSQIEGDRITVFLRYFLQNKFGGVGIGYVPMTDLATSQNFVVREDHNLVRYSVFHNYLKSGEYHLSGCAWRMTGGTAFFRFELAKGVGYGQLKLMWGNAAKAWKLKVLDKDSTVVWQTDMPEAKGFQVTTLQLPAGTTRATLVFEAEQSPDLYGLLFDGNGITVDNYAIRGHAGNGLLTISNGFIQQQLKHQNTRLVILQYGGNVVPYKNMENFGWLEEANYNLIMKFKRLMPEASILVMGVGDAAYKTEDGTMATYPTVPLIRDAQKRSAARARVAFWDLFRVMGGEGSIIEWVNNDPPMAAEDYAHLSWHGQRLIARELYLALMREYEAYQRRINNEKAKQSTPKQEKTQAMQH